MAERSPRAWGWTGTLGPAQPQNWYSFTSGVRGISWSFSFGKGGRARAEIYIDTQDAERNEEILDELLRDRAAIEKDYGQELEWERLDDKRACRVACYRGGTIEEATENPVEILAWAVDHLLRMKRVFGPRIKGFGG